MIVIDREALQESADRLGQIIAEVVPTGATFFLWLDCGSAATYVSNGARPDMVAALRELANHLERAARGA